MTSHAIGGRKLSRKQGPRLALYKNLIVSVLRYERIQTTEAKAKEIRPQVERTIPRAKKGGLSGCPAVLAALADEPLVVEKLFDEIVPKYANRTSGYCRITKIGIRQGDSAPLVQLELI